MHRVVAMSVVCLVACARACEVCVVDECHAAAEPIFRNQGVTGQIAVDRDRQVLYLNMHHKTNAVKFGVGPFRIRSEDGLNIHTDSLTVDQHAHVLYAADNGILYKLPTGKLHPRAMPQLRDLGEPQLLFYKDFLYYTTKHDAGLHSNENGETMNFTRLSNYNITDFVVDKNNKIYFVSDDNVYVYHRSWNHGPEVVDRKKYSLSTDRNGDVYFGNAAQNSIHKLDKSDRMVLYAAYTTGSVGQFVFDKDNHIVIHDPTSDTVAYWTPMGTKCSIEPPRLEYLVRNETEINASPPEVEGSGEADMLTTVFKH